MKICVNVLCLLVNAILRIAILNFNLQDINDGNGKQQEDKDCDPLKCLIEFNLAFQTMNVIIELRNG